MFKKNKLSIIVTGATLMVAFLFSSNAQAGGSYYDRTLSQIKVESPKVINFESTDVSTDSGYWSNYGVKFSSNNGKAVYINDYNRGGDTSSGEYSISNNAAWPNTSNNDPLIITFKNPTNIVGFYLGNGDVYGQQVTAVISFFDYNGNLIGDFTVGDIKDEVNKFVGFETINPFYKITIDYGDTSLSEEIDDLMFVGSESNSTKAYCQDTDNGLNYYTKGKATLYSDTINSATDFCDGDYTLREYFCTTGDVKLGTGAGYNSKLYECPYGCSEGACKKAPLNKPTCQDDGHSNDIYTKGTLNAYTPTYGSVVVEDYCVDANRKRVNPGSYVEKLVCLDDDDTYAYTHKLIKCEYGCSNGACKTAPEENVSCYNVTGKGYLAKVWNDNKVWYVDNSYKYWLPSENIFFSWFSSFANIQILTTEKMNQFTVGKNVCLNNGSNIPVEVPNDNCSDLTGGDGEYSLCVGNKMIHNDSKITVKNQRNNDNYVWLRVENGSKDSIIIYKGQTREIISKLNFELVKISYLKNDSGSAVIKFESNSQDSDTQTCKSRTVKDSYLTDVCLKSNVYHSPTGITVKITSDHDNYLDLDLEGVFPSGITVMKDQPLIIESNSGEVLALTANNAKNGLYSLSLSTFTKYKFGDRVIDDGIYSAYVGDSWFHNQTNTDIKFSYYNTLDNHLVVTLDDAKVDSMTLQNMVPIVISTKSGIPIRLKFDGFDLVSERGYNVLVEEAVDVSCGNSMGNDGLYSACIGDEVKHNGTGIRIRVDYFSSNYANISFLSGTKELGAQIRTDKSYIVTATNGNKLKITFDSVTLKHGVFMNLETL